MYHFFILHPERIMETLEERIKRAKQPRFIGERRFADGVVGVIYERGDAAIARELAKLTDATPVIDRTISHEQLADETRFDRA